MRRRYNATVLGTSGRAAAADTRGMLENYLPTLIFLLVAGAFGVVLLVLG